MKNISLHKAHPWHGISIGPDAPRLVTCFIELVPTDTIKYEVDKLSGYLRIDRPQKFSNICPTLYGFLPQTYCAEQVGEYSGSKINRPGLMGDGDPIDVCILTEKDVSRGDVLVQAIPIGGLRLIDRGQADDKILAVLKDDALFGEWKDIESCPKSVLDRLTHYFLTYKGIPGSASSLQPEMHGVYGREEAYEVISRARADYQAHFA